MMMVFILWVGPLDPPVSIIYEVFTLTNSNGDVLEINDIGEFVFPTGLPNGASYSVEADTSVFGGQSCDVTGGSNGDGTGIIAGADVTDILVTCTEN